jgi:hypothetical protein
VLAALIPFPERGSLVNYSYMGAGNMLGLMRVQ